MYTYNTYNMETIEKLKELSTRAQKEEVPQTDILSKVKGDKESFLNQWKDTLMDGGLGYVATNIFASVVGAHIIAGLDVRFGEVKELAAKLSLEHTTLQSVKSYSYFLEWIREEFSKKEQTMMELPGSLCSVGSDKQTIFNLSFTSFRLDHIAENVMVSAKKREIDSSYDDSFQFVTGGDGREVYDWLIKDYSDSGEPNGHFFYNRYMITGHIIQGFGVLVKEKSTLNLVGYATYTYDTSTQGPGLELEVIEVLKSYQGRGVSKLILSFISTKLHPNVSVITGSPTEESFPVWTNYPLCQFQLVSEWGYGCYDQEERMFISMKPFATPSNTCPSGFAIKIDEESQYYPVNLKNLDAEDEFKMFKVNGNNRIQDIYLIESPILVAQDKEREYRKIPIKLSLFYDREFVAKKEFKDDYGYDGLNDENCIYLARTCIWIGYLYGELGAKVTEVLDASQPTTKRQKLE